MVTVADRDFLLSLHKPIHFFYGLNKNCISKFRLIFYQFVVQI